MSQWLLQSLPFLIVFKNNLCLPLTKIIYNWFICLLILFLFLSLIRSSLTRFSNTRQFLCKVKKKIINKRFQCAITKYSKFRNTLRTIPASAEEQSLKFSVKVLSKTAASAALLAKCNFRHAYSRTIDSSKLRENKQKLHIAYLTSWHNSILVKIKNSLRTIKAENP